MDGDDGGVSSDGLDPARHSRASSRLLVVLVVAILFIEFLFLFLLLFDSQDMT